MLQSMQVLRHAHVDSLCATVHAVWSLQVVVWDLVSQACLPPLAGHKGEVTGCVFSPDSQLLATCSAVRLQRHLFRTSHAVTTLTACLQSYSLCAARWPSGCLGPCNFPLSATRVNACLLQG